MLRDSDVATMIPAKNLESTRRFYEDVLGFSPVREDPGSVSYRAANGRFNLYQTEFAGTAQHTLIGFTVNDISAAVVSSPARGSRSNVTTCPTSRPMRPASPTWAPNGRPGSMIPRATC